jgi:carboxymethylenebutenolidase
MVTFASNGGTADGYLAVPAGGTGPAVIVIQEWWGLAGHIESVCERFAAEGFVALAPDLYHGAATDEPDEAMRLMMGLAMDTAARDIAGAARYLADRPECSGKVGAVGFCLGGLLAFLTATRTSADATVSYYGVGLDNVVGEAAELTKPVMLHIAEEDGFVSKAAQAQIVAALKDKPNVTIHTYPGRDHAFARHGGEHFHQEDADKAGRRSLDFFKQHLG